MPTYEYKCDACGHAFEKFHSITADPVKKCPVCGKNKVRRLISMGAGLIFKGSGFYITDYRDAGYKDSAKADGATSTDAAAKTETAAKGDGPATADAASTGESKPAAEKPAPAATPAPAAEKPSSGSKSSKAKKSD